MELTVSSVRIGDSLAFSAFIRDITEREQAKQEILHLRAYLKNIIDSMPSVLAGGQHYGATCGYGQVSATLFAESGAAWDNGGTPEEYYSSAGGELLAEIILGHNLVLDTRFGYAHGFDDIIGEDRYYIRVGRAF